MRLYAVLAILIAIYTALFPVIDGFSRERVEERDVRYLPPNELLQLSALEFQNLAADILFLNGLTFAGSRKPGVQDPETWQWLYKILDASSYLNPYNKDPYFLAQGNLTWDGRMYHETNTLLERGMTYRKNDWTLPFFIGFNHYYFLRDPAAGAHYLSLAADMPDSPKLTLTILASRLYAQSQLTELAIAMVKDDYEKARDENLRRAYKIRLESLVERLNIEKAVEAYEKVYKKKPLSLDVLISRNFLKQIPTDPDGGEYFLDDQGRVKNTKEDAVEKQAESYK
jgi:hypothetical protein